MSLLSEVQKKLDGDMAESPDTPNPLRLEPWGEDRVLGIVIPPMERKTASGIYVETAASAPKSSTMQVIKVSEKVTDEFPRLQRIKAQYDPEGDGLVFEGPYVAFAPSGVSTWSYGTIEFAVIHAKAIRGSYDPFYEGVAYSFKEGDV